MANLRNEFGIILLCTSLVMAQNICRNEEDILNKLALSLAQRQTVPLPVPLWIEKDTTEQEKMDKRFKRLIHFANVLGMFNNFVTEQTKNFVRKLNAVYDIEDAERALSCQ